MAFAMLLVASSFLGNELLGQSKEGFFAFAKAETRSKFLPETLYNYKFETAQKIFNDLVKARGDFRTIPPQFVMNKGRQYIAWMDQNKGEIGIEEKAYDVCTQFGKDSLNALAALISHEIIHYYEKHDWNRAFININADLKVADKLKALQADGLQYEAQADYYGGILAITAGFNTFMVFESFLGKAYKAYGLPDEIDGYPSLSERRALYRNTADQLRQIHSIYQTANLLALTGYHDLANNYYKWILRDYGSYEVYNNFGANAALAALNLFEPKEMPFVLPIELDLKSRLDELVTRVPESVLRKRNQLLADAGRWLTHANQLNPKQSAPLVNLAIVQLLQGNKNKALQTLENALLLSRTQDNSQTLANAEIVLGVMAALEDDKKRAYDYFKSAQKGNKILASINLDRLEAVDSGQKYLPPPAKGIETIEGVRLEDFLAELETMSSFSVADDIYCGKKSKDHSDLFLHYAEDGEEILLFHRTRDDYAGATLKGIRLGDGIEKIHQEHGIPKQTLNLPRGTCLVYPNQRILFLLNQDGLLQEWVVYYQKLPN